MKIKQLSILLIFGLLLSACAAATPDSSQLTSGIYTAVAQTLTAQYTPEVATDTPEPVTATAAPTSFDYITNTPFIAPTSTSTCDGSVYVDDVTIPDNTSMVVGKTFTKTWTIQNTGTCAWTSTYALKFASGNQMNGASTAIGSAVAPGSTINVSISMTAPSTPGAYTGYWRMVNDSSAFFGGYVSVSINVNAIPTGTLTLTPTMTKTPTVTPVATQTPWVVTATPVTPTATTPASTSTPVPPTETPTSSGS